MNGIVINIDPVIFQLDGFELRWYGIMIMLAIVAALGVAVREGKRKGIPSGVITTLLPWVVFAGILGARLFHVVDRWDYYVVNPLSIFQVQQGGLAIWGGLVGGAVAAAIYARIARIPIPRLADTVVPALLVAQIIGRFGCIINGDAYGGITDLPWGFIYTHHNALIPHEFFGVPTHPYPVYEIFLNGLVLLAFLRWRHKLPGEGLLFLSYLSLYSLIRFLLTFVRQENIIFWGFQQAQLMALAVFIVSAAAFIYFTLKAKRQPVMEEQVYQ